MGKTVIEELVISLGLDAKKLEESKALEAINTIRSSVTSLNDELKQAEKSFASLGKIKMGSIDSKQSKPKVVADQNAILPKPVSPATQTKPIKVENVPSSKDKTEEKRKEKVPTNMKGFLTGIGGALGSLAAGAYLFKSVASGISMVYDSMSQFLGMGQQAKNTAESIGLSAEKLSVFGNVAKAIGKDSEAVISDIDKLGKEYTSELPGYFHQGLAAMGITTRKETGERRPFEEVLKEVFDKVMGMQGDKAYKKSVLRDFLGFSEGTSELAMLGWDKMQKMNKGMVASGLAPSEEMLQQEAQLKRVENIAGMKKDMIKRKIGLETSDLLVNAFAGIMGTSGFEEVMTKLQTMKPEELKEELKKSGIYEEQFKEIAKFMGIPESQYQNVVRPGQMQDCRTGAVTENMVINLNVDRDKAKADVNINGRPMSNVRVNLSPNHTGQ